MLANLQEITYISCKNRSDKQGYISFFFYIILNTVNYTCD